MAKRFSIVILVVFVGIAAAVVATVGDSARTRTSAQSAGVDGAASCGTGNPLHGRTQGVVDAIVQRLRNGGTLGPSGDCSDVTSSHLGGISGVLDVSGRGLTRLRANDFAGLTAYWFQRVDLSNNEIVTVPANAFSGISQARTIGLSNNKITTIEADAFKGVPRIATIDLAGNKIRTLAANAFSGIPVTNQMSLDMPGNEISSLPSAIFSSLRLRRLNLSDNYLTSDQLGFLTTAQEYLGNLYLDNNLLTSDGSGSAPDLPTNIFGIHGGRASQINLRMGGNKIRELPVGVFSGWSGVRSIDLSYNQIGSLQSGVFNGLTWVASSWSGGVLNLEGNPLTAIGASAFNGGACGTAVSWDRGFNATNCIHFLNLNNTLLETLPSELFSGMDRLRDLRLDGSRLTTIPSDLYAGLTRISTVHLQGNRITSLPAGAFSDLQGLGTLDLRGNALTSLPAEVFTGLPTHDSGPNMGLLERPNTVDVRGNPLGAVPISVLVALFPAGHDIKTGPIPEATPRTAGPDDGTREKLANCGVGHALTGRTAEVVYGIIRGAFGRPSDWSTLVALNHPMYYRWSWDGTLARHQTRYGETPSIGDPPAIYPALCNLLTANDMGRVTGMSVGSTGIKSLESGDFAGLFNLVSLQIYSSSNEHTFRTLPEGIFDGLTKLRSLIIRGSNLMSLRARVFDRLTNLRSLDLSYNLLTTFPSGVFDRLTRLHTLSINDNRLSSLPTSLFSRLSTLRYLYMQRNDLDAEDIPVGTFNGMVDLREISMRSNNFDSLYIEVFENQGLTKLKTLRISERAVGHATSDEFGEFERSLPSLVRLDRMPGAQVEVPTPTPTNTPTPTFTPTLEPAAEPIITRIEPLVRSLTISVNTEIRLGFVIHNYRDWIDNELSTHPKLRITWTTPEGGSFSESTGEGSNRDGQVNDREVVWRAPSTPGQYIVRSEILPPGSCSGDELACKAEFIVNVTALSATPTPEATPCATRGLVPTSLNDADGNAYSVITPAEGGEYQGDGAWVSVPRGAVDGCGYIGIRAYAQPGTTPSSIDHWATAGQRFSLDMIGPAGNPFPNLVLRHAADVCVPLPDRFRATLSDLTLLRESDAGNHELTSKVRRHATDGFMVCGFVSEFPSVVVAASRGLISSTAAIPTPTPVTETPGTGGESPSGAYVLLAFVLGVLSVAGAMVLTGIGRMFRIGVG